MKKAIFGLLLAVIVFASCEKEDLTPPLNEQSFIGIWEGDLINNKYTLAGSMKLTVDSSLNIVEFVPLGIHTITGSINGSTIVIFSTEIKQEEGYEHHRIYSYKGKITSTTTIEMQLVSLTVRDIIAQENRILGESVHPIEYDFTLTKTE
jgi:hypothetical protein